MKRFALVAFVLVLSSGCAGRYYWHSHTHYGYAAYPTAPAQVVVTQPPPPLPLTTELRPPQPSGNSIWIDGHWTYNGMWAWVDGTWVNGYSGWVWTPPVIVIVDGYYVLHRGYFRQPTYRPAPAYVHPNRIHISVGGHIAANTHQHGQRPPGYQPRPDAPQPPLDRPRQLEVPGAIVRTPPAPPPVREHPSRPAPIEPERPVLVAPGATVSRRPVQRQTDDVAPAPVNVTPTPNQPPPVLSNVPPVVERPAHDHGKDPNQAAPANSPPVVVVAPPKAPARDVMPPVAPPTQVAPSGAASRGAGRVRTDASPAPQQAQQVGRDRGNGRSTNTTQSAPQRGTNQTTARPERPHASTFSSMQSQLNRERENNRAQAAPVRAAPQAERTQAAPTRPSREATRERGKPTIVQPGSNAGRPAGRGRKDPEAKPVAKPATITCTLITTEAPRGGQLDVRGEGFGATPVVRIGGKVTRILRRNATEIRVQIPRDSNGGSVTVHAGSTSGECGSLTIIGTDR